jgi:hypothetical protein
VLGDAGKEAIGDGGGILGDDWDLQAVEKIQTAKTIMKRRIKSVLKVTDNKIYAGEQR